MDHGLTRQPLPLAEALLGAGVRVLQYRAKAGVEAALVRALHERTRSYGAALIVNDDLEAALAADGWHAGQEDLAAYDAVAARARLESRLFGVSCGTSTEARAAERYGADYVGVGPYAATSTKSDAGTPIGRSGVAAVARATRLPVIAIGGIDASNIADVARSGAAMAAIASAFASAADPAALARDLMRRWDAAR